MQTVFLYLPTNVKKHYEVKMNDYLKIKKQTKQNQNMPQVIVKLQT